MKLIFISLTMFLLSGCATLESVYNDLYIGMDRVKLCQVTLSVNVYEDPCVGNVVAQYDPTIEILSNIEKSKYFIFKHNRLAAIELTENEAINFALQGQNGASGVSAPNHLSQVGRSSYPKFVGSRDAESAKPTRERCDLAKSELIDRDRKLLKIKNQTSSQNRTCNRRVKPCSFIVKPCIRTNHQCRNYSSSCRRGDYACSQRAVSQYNQCNSNSQQAYNVCHNNAVRDARLEQGRCESGNARAAASCNRNLRVLREQVTDAQRAKEEASRDFNLYCK